jgi:hypothetical protein
MSFQGLICSMTRAVLRWLSLGWEEFTVLIGMADPFVVVDSNHSMSSGPGVDPARHRRSSCGLVAG